MVWVFYLQATGILTGKLDICTLYTRKIIINNRVCVILIGLILLCFYLFIFCYFYF